MMITAGNKDKAAQKWCKKEKMITKQLKLTKKEGKNAVKMR